MQRDYFEREHEESVFIGHYIDPLSDDQLKEIDRPFMGLTFKEKVLYLLLGLTDFHLKRRLARYVLKSRRTNEELRLTPEGELLTSTQRGELEDRLFN